MEILVSVNDNLDLSWWWGRKKMVYYNEMTHFNVDQARSLPWWNILILIIILIRFYPYSDVCHFSSSDQPSLGISSLHIRFDLNALTIAFGRPNTVQREADNHNDNVNGMSWPKWRDIFHNLKVKRNTKKTWEKYFKLIYRYKWLWNNFPNKNVSLENDIRRPFFRTIRFIYSIFISISILNYWKSSQHFEFVHQMRGGGGEKVSLHPLIPLPRKVIFFNTGEWFYAIRIEIPFE